MVIFMKSIPASDFKAHCLSYMKLTQLKREAFLITKHGKPIARLLPIDEIDTKTHAKMAFDSLKDCTAIHGNIMDPIDTSWDVLSE